MELYSFLQWLSIFMIEYSFITRFRLLMELYSFLLLIYRKAINSLLVGVVSVSLWSYIHSYQDTEMVSISEYYRCFRLLMELYSFLHDYFKSFNRLEVILCFRLLMELYSFLLDGKATKNKVVMS